MYYSVVVSVGVGKIKVCGMKYTLLENQRVANVKKTRLKQTEF